MLHLAGVVHPKPGPKNTSKNAIAIFACDATNDDIITISEAWLSDRVDSDETTIAGFQPPIRKDRPNDPRGAVAVSVKHHLACKPRPNLSVPLLEVVG